MRNLALRLLIAPASNNHDAQLSFTCVFAYRFHSRVCLNFLVKSMLATAQQHGTRCVPYFTDICWIGSMCTTAGTLPIEGAKDYL
jgi:hypothetical protein